MTQVLVTPGNASAMIGTTRTFVGEPRDATGSPVAGQSVSWSSSDTTVATVAGGVATAIKVGSTTITARVGSASGSAGLSVILVPAAAVVVTPSPDTLVVTTTAQLTAAVKDSAGGALTGRAVTWASSDSSVARVSSAGLVTAQGLGTASIKATVEGKVGTAQLVVRPVPVSQITLTLENPRLAAGQATHALAVAKDSAGNTLAGRVIKFASNAPSVADVDAAGLVTAKTAGDATISASSEGYTADAQVTVIVAGPSVTVTLSPSLPQATLAAVTAVLTLGDSTVISGSGATRSLSTATDTGTVPALAISSTGDAVAAGYAALDGSVPLTVESTALVLARSVMPLVDYPFTDEGSIRQAITQRPEFAVLVDTIRAVMSRGGSYAHTPAAVQMAAKVDSALVESLPAATLTRLAPDHRQLDLAPDPSRRPQFATYPIQITSTPTTVTFTNPLHANFGFRVDPTPGRDDVLPGRVVCFLCWPPRFETSAATTYSIPTTPTGDFTATASFGMPARLAVAKQGADDIISAIFRLIGLKVPEELWAGLFANAEGLVDLEGAAREPNLSSAIQVVKDQMVARATDITQLGLQAVPNLAARKGAIAFMRELAAPLALADDIIWLGDRIGFYRDVSRYWDADPETIRMCLMDGVLYSLCNKVNVSLSATSITVGSTARATAHVLDEYGTEISGASVAWSSSAPAVATIDAASGTITAVSAGTTTITATSSGQSGSALLTVTQPATLVMSRNSASLTTGSELQLTATGTDAAGQPIAAAAVVWTSSAPPIATVAAGLVRAVAPGTATISASAAGATATATVVVTEATIASVEIQPPSPTVTIGASEQLTAVAKSANGSTITGTTATWASANAEIATIDGTGLLKGVSAGTTSITATVDGTPGTTLVTVQPEGLQGTIIYQDPSTSANLWELTRGGRLYFTTCSDSSCGDVRYFSWTPINGSQEISLPNGRLIAGVNDRGDMLTVMSSGACPTPNNSCGELTLANGAVIPLADSLWDPGRLNNQDQVLVYTNGCHGYALWSPGSGVSCIVVSPEMASPSGYLLNNSGEVAGTYGSCVAGSPTNCTLDEGVFTWSQQSGSRSIFFDPSGNSDMAEMAMNDNGAVVIMNDVGARGTLTSPWSIWDPGTGMRTIGIGSSPFDINNRNEVVATDSSGYFVLLPSGQRIRLADPACPAGWRVYPHVGRPWAGISDAGDIAGGIFCTPPGASKFTFRNLLVLWSLHSASGEVSPTAGVRMMKTAPPNRRRP